MSCKYHSTCRLGPNHVTSCACQKSCPAAKQPVCGSNGQTYNNECLMKQNSCKKRDDIQLIVKAPCGEYQAQLSLQFFSCLISRFYSHFKFTSSLYTPLPLFQEDIIYSLLSERSKTYKNLQNNHSFSVIFVFLGVTYSAENCTLSLYPRRAS